MSNKNAAIPPGYMTVGEFAKKTGTTVRTLQYYDKEGLLVSSGKSEGGRRLYTEKDIVKLHQILSLKYLGFSLDDIKNKLKSLNTPSDVASVLTEHADAIRKKIEDLSETLKTIEALKDEIMQMQSVDFKKYADITVNLQMNNDMYWTIKHFDDDILDNFRSRFDKESGSIFMNTFNRLFDKALHYQSDNVPPEGVLGQDLAKEFWDFLMEFTGGDMSLLTKINEFSEYTGGLNDDWMKKQAKAKGFLEPALEAYFESLNYDPLEEEKK